MSIKASSVATNERVSVDFLSLGKDNVEESNGFYFDGKKIRCMPGFDTHFSHYTATNCNKVIYNSYNDRIMFFLNDGGVLLWDDVNNTTTRLYGVAECPQFIFDCLYDDNRYYALLCGNRVYILKKDGTFDVKYSVPSYRCGVYHHGRMFDVNTREIDEFWWTEQGMGSHDLELNKGGFMKLPTGAGSIRRMFSLGDRIVILREYGINVMRGMVDVRNFTLEPNTVMLSEKVIDNTAVSNGKKVWFCTQHYIYCYDGTLTQKEHPYGADDCSVTCLDVIDARYLYLSVTKGSLSYLVRYDPLTDEFVQFARNCKFICRTPRGLFTLKSKYVGNLIKDAGFGNTMKFKRIDLNDCKFKTLKRVVLNAEPGVKLNVAFGDAVRSFDAGVYDDLNLTARSFDFSLEGCGEVNDLKAVWEVFG